MPELKTNAGDPFTVRVYDDPDRGTFKDSISGIWKMEVIEGLLVLYKSRSSNIVTYSLEDIWKFKTL